MKSKYYLCTFTNPERGESKQERETAIVRASNKTEASFKAKAKVKKAVGAEQARHYDLWSIEPIKTTF